MRGTDFDAFAMLAAIVRHGTLSSAANALNKTTATISYRLAQLESHYGIEMLDRSGYRVTLTPKGSRLLEEATRVLEQASVLDSVAHQLNHEWEPKLEIVIDGLLDSEIILDAINEIKNAGAPTTFQLVIEYLGGVEHRFNQGDADVMISLTFPDTAHISSRHLFDIDIVLVASPRLGIQNLAPLSLADLSQYLEISVQDSGYEEPVPGRSLGGPDLFFVGDFYTKKQAILKGMGIGWMPQHWVAKELAAGELVEVNYQEGSTDRYPVYVGTRKSKLAGKAQQMFIKLLKAKFS